MAGVKVAENDKGRVKYASVRDLRRAFGFRWAMRVMPPVLMQPVRHARIETTQDFYVGRNAEAAAETIWDAVSNTSGNTPLNSTIAGNGGKP